MSGKRMIYDVLREQAERRPDAVAVLAPDRDPLTYGMLLAAVEGTAARLRAIGVARRQRVVLVLPNGSEMATAFLAAACAAAAAPLNPAYQAAEFELYLCDLGARAVVVQRDLDSPVREVARRHGIPILELTPLPEEAAGLFRLDGEPGDSTIDRDSAQPQDVALVLHTSGTTARPKIVPLTHGNICASAGNVAAALALRPEDRCLNVMPLFHIHGLVAAVLASIHAGASVVCTPGFRAEAFFDWLATWMPTWYTAVPTMHQAILARARAAGVATANSSLRLIRSCSASLPPLVLAELEQAFGVPVIESYGMTEAAHQMTSNPLPPRLHKPGTVGVAAGPEVAIVDEAGRLLPAGHGGEIVIRGENVMHGYENNPAANAKAFTDGWFRTGDRGVIDADGFLTIVGRIKEMVNRGGEKIAPREVDEALLAHPDVQEAVAFAVPHRSLGEDLATAVVLRAGRTADPAELRRFLLARLAAHKVPSQVVVVDAIPKGPTGKVQRIGLAARLASQLAPVHTPPRSELEKALTEIWARVLGLAKVGIHDNFFLLGGDSLAGTQVGLEIEKLTGRSVGAVAAVRGTYHRRVGGRAAGRGIRRGGVVPGAAAAPGNRDSVVPRAGPRRGRVHVCRAGPLPGRRTPGLRAAIPRQAEQDKGVANAMVDELAERYVRQVRRTQPRGPYLLGGFCFGGEVVFRMAQRLHAEGEAVGLVGIIELYVGRAVRWPFRGVREHWRELQPRDWRHRVEYIRERFNGLRRRIRDWSGAGQRVAPRPEPAAGQLARGYYPGRITLFRCREFDSRRHRDDPLMGWAGLAGEIRVQQIPGNRTTAFVEPHVRVLAAEISRCIQEAVTAQVPAPHEPERQLSSPPA